MVWISIKDSAMVLLVEFNLVGLFPPSTNSKNVKLILNSNCKCLKQMIKQTNKQTTQLDHYKHSFCIYELYRFWFWFGLPYLLYSEFLYTTLARITSAALKLKWQSAKQLVVVSLIHVQTNKQLNNNLSFYIGTVQVLVGLICCTQSSYLLL
jgi:hypothetical protein